jgi:hypothetical protein
LRVPTATSIELAQFGEQAMHRRIQVCSQLGDVLAQLLEIPIHEKLYTK